MPRPRRGFSMVEVVLALAIAAFCLMSLLGLFSVGITTGRDSAEEMLAAHIAQSLVATRRAAPYADLSTTPSRETHFPLPPLTENVEANFASAILLDVNGNETADRAAARYRLIYVITLPDDLEKPARVYLRLMWPALAATPQNIVGAYELFTSIAQQAEPAE